MVSRTQIFRGAPSGKSALAERLRFLRTDHGIFAPGTHLYQWWQQARAEEFYEHMAQHAVWVRRYRDAARGVRIRLPACETHWNRIEQTLMDWSKR